MKNIIRDFLKMPYYQNYAACSGKVHNVAKHEDAVEDILIQNGLTEEPRRMTKVQRNAWLDGESADDLPNNTYISQPCGTHNSPDFIIKLAGQLYFVECKSTRLTASPVYNSGLPTPKYIYVFSSKKHDETTVYLGRDVVEPQVYKMLEEANQKIKEICNGVSAEVRAMSSNGHGVGIYARPMYNHAGTKDKTDYFQNPRRRELEQNVLDFV